LLTLAKNPTLAKLQSSSNAPCLAVLMQGVAGAKDPYRPPKDLPLQNRLPRLAGLNEPSSIVPRSFLSPPHFAGANRSMAGYKRPPRTTTITRMNVKHLYLSNQHIERSSGGAFWPVGLFAFSGIFDDEGLVVIGRQARDRHEADVRDS